MNHEQRDPNAIDFIAPVGGVTGDKLYRVGSLVVVAMGGLNTILEGDTASGILRIHAQLGAKTGESWSLGDDLFFDDATSQLTKTDSGGLIRCAKATADKDSDAITGWVLFDGGLGASARYLGDITAVTAGTGLTGGGTSGALTIALDAASIASLGKADAALPAAKVATKVVTVALGQSSGSTAADPTWVGATKLGYSPDSGNDQEIVSVVIDGTGAAVVTLGGASTAEAQFSVSAVLA